MLQNLGFCFFSRHVPFVLFFFLNLSFVGYFQARGSSSDDSERDPQYDTMLNQMVGRIKAKPGGKAEMGEVTSVLFFFFFLMLSGQVYMCY